jgi:Na+/H+ antiporter NhaD/arsenite permease-like protein
LLKGRPDARSLVRCLGDKRLAWDYKTTLTLVIFVLTYASVAVGYVWELHLDRTGIALLGAIAMVVTGCISGKQALHSINFSSLFMLYGLMILSGQLRLGGFYTWIAQKISGYLDRPGFFLGLLMVLSGLLSAFLINDVVCLAFAPVVTVPLLRRNLNPVPFLIALAVSANIGAAATLMGNPQNIMVAQVAGLHFQDYILWCCPPVVGAMALAYAIIWLLGKNRLALDQPVQLKGDDFPQIDRWQTSKGLLVAGIVVVLYFTELPRAMVTVAAAGFLLASHRLHSKDLLSRVDWPLLTLFTGLFIVVGAFQLTGLGEQGMAWLRNRGFDLANPYLLSVATGILSNLMSNAAAIMLLINLVDLHNPVNGYLLSLANSFAGNLILLGSLANLIVVEEAKSVGVEISFREFFRYGLPITLSAYGVLGFWIFLRT